MKALVTGASGFVGQWLCKGLLRAGWGVTGTTLTGPPPAGILTDAELAHLNWRTLNLIPGTDRRTLGALLDRERPDAIFHLAAITFVPAAEQDPGVALDTNVGAAVRLLQSMRTHREETKRDPVLLVVGSGEQYGRHAESALPLTERHECRPRTFYGATKCAQEHFALAAARHDGLRVVATRSFNHSGRGQQGPFLLPALVQRALQARRAPGTHVPIGNADTVRDFLHVEDVVAAYIALAERGHAGEAYNVCSGEGVTVAAVAAEVLAEAGVTASLHPDPALQRPVEVPHLVGDNSKIKRDTGWSPRRTRADIIADLLHAAS